MMRRKRTASTESVSSRLSELPRSCEISNNACTSWRAAAMEVRKSMDASLEVPGFGFAAFSKPAAGASPLLIFRSVDSFPAATLWPCAIRSNSTYRRERASTTRGANALPDSDITTFIASSSGRAPAILPVAGQGVQAVHRREDARANWNFLAGDAIRITAAVPLFMMGADDRHHGTRELYAFENLGADNGVDL